MSDHKQGRLRRSGHAALIIALAVLVGGVMMLWAWNTLAVDLLQAPEIRFRHVLAFQAGLAALTVLPLVLVRHLRRGRPTRTT